MRSNLVMMPREFQFKPGERLNNGPFMYNPAIVQPHDKHASQYASPIFFLVEIPELLLQMILPPDFETAAINLALF